MCVIAAIPQGKIISEDTFLTMWENNSDGAGMMYSQHGKIKVIKELTDYYKLYKQYKSIQGKMNIVLHFRIATSGSLDSYNIHPFKVNDNLYFCHNGILNCVDVPILSKENDTQIFNNSVLKHLPVDFIHNKGINKLLSHTIGSNNKFVFLDNSGHIKIINKKAGYVDKDIWFSNLSYCYDRLLKRKLVKYCDNCLTEEKKLLDCKEYDMQLCNSCYTWFKEDEKTYNINKKWATLKDSDLF